MRIFDHFNTKGTACIICATKKDKKTVLVAQDGTASNGVEEAVPAHLDCLELRYQPGAGVIYQRVMEV